MQLLYQTSTATELGKTYIKCLKCRLQIPINSQTDMSCKREPATWQQTMCNVQHCNNMPRFFDFTFVFAIVAIFTQRIFRYSCTPASQPAKQQQQLCSSKITLMANSHATCVASNWRTCVAMSCTGNRTHSALMLHLSYFLLLF